MFNRKFNKKKSNKKAQGLSITTIIIAALSVVVLVVLVAIFTGQMGSWIQKLTGGGSGDKATDSISAKCIPTDTFYNKIDDARNQFNKFKATAPLENNGQYAIATQTTYNTLSKAVDDAIGLKNAERTTCKIQAEEQNCKEKCQWIN